MATPPQDLPDARAVPRVSIPVPLPVRELSPDVLAAQFDTFVRTRSPALLRTAYLLTGDQYLAEDLVQAALARVHRAWRRLEDRGNAEAYVRRTMYNLHVSWWHRQRPTQPLDPVAMEGLRATGTPSQSVLALRITVRQALARLTRRQRAVLVLRFYEDRSEAETARLLGVSPGTVKSQTSKALARLRAVAPELGDLYLPDRRPFPRGTCSRNGAAR